TFPSSYRWSLFYGIREGDRNRTDHDGISVPSCVLIIERLYSGPSHEHRLTKENLTTNETAAIKNHSLEFLRSLYAEPFLYEKYPFDRYFESTHVRDHYLLEGLRYLRLDIIPVIRSVLGDEKEDEISEILRQHMAIEATIYYKKSQKNLEKHLSE
ncbi:hypothetical protein PMAYCL1PPCAC_10992, partial [Pristionchus mayeri]